MLLVAGSKPENMRRTLLVLAVAALLAFAGCSGSGGPGTDGTTTTGDVPSDTETQTQTTATPSTDDTTPSPDGESDGSSDEESTDTDLVDDPQEFPWLTDAGVNETTLFRTHALTVNNESSYTTRAVTRQETTNSDSKTVTRYRLEASADQSRARVVINRSVRSQQGVRTDNRTQYRELVDGTDTIYYRVATDGSVDYRTDSEPARNFSTFYRQATGYDLTFIAMQFDLSYDQQTERDGRTLYRLTGNSVTEGTQLDGSVSNLSATVLVDRRGVVRSLEYSFDGSTGDTLVRTTYTFETTNLGSTTVDRPGWLDQTDQ